MSAKGLDLSYHNNVTDFNAIKKAGYDFVILRIGYRGWGTGEIVKDTKFEDYFNRARKAGLHIGVYFFSQAINTTEAIEEARYCLKEIGNRQLEYPIYIDQELSGAPNKQGRADKLSKDIRTQVLIAFCETIENNKFYAAMYMSESWLKNNVDYTQLKKYDKWIAKWSLLKPSSLYGSYGLWQNTNNLTVSGVAGRVDGNVSYYDYPNIMIKNNLNNYRLTRLYDIKIVGANDTQKEEVTTLCSKLGLKAIVEDYLTEG